MNEALIEILRDINKRINRVERAVGALASEPGQPHHAAEMALKILYGKSED